MEEGGGKVNAAGTHRWWTKWARTYRMAFNRYIWVIKGMAVWGHWTWRTVRGGSSSSSPPPLSSSTHRQLYDQAFTHVPDAKEQTQLPIPRANHGIRREHQRLSALRGHLKFRKHHPDDAGLQSTSHQRGKNTYKSPPPEIERSHSHDWPVQAQEKVLTSWLWTWRMYLSCTGIRNRSCASSRWSRGRRRRNFQSAWSRLPCRGHRLPRSRLWGLHWPRR